MVFEGDIVEGYDPKEDPDQNINECIETVCQNELENDDPFFRKFYFNIIQETVIINLQCWDDDNSCYSIQEYDVCTSRPESERNNCEPDWSDFPAPVGFPTDFRTCYNDTTGKTCYTYPEWKASTVVTACAIDNKENDEPKNKWYNKLDESVILLSVVGVAVLVGLFVAGYYGYKKLKQNEGVQNTENLL